MSTHVEDLITEYLLGVLPAAEQEAVGAHLAVCARCAAERAAVEAALGALPLALAPQPPSDGARRRLIADLDGAHRFDPFIDPLAELMDVADGTAAGYLRDLRRPEAWGASPWQGVRLIHVAGGPRTEGADVGFVEVQPGVRFPRHRHTGDEFTFIVQGTGREDDGTVLRAGDLVVRRVGSRHSFTALEGPVFVFGVVVFGYEIEE